MCVLGSNDSFGEENPELGDRDDVKACLQVPGGQLEGLRQLRTDLSRLSALRLHTHRTKVLMVG